MKPGSVFYTEAWLVYKGMSELGYKHFVINHLNEFVSEHTKQQLWCDLKEWVKQPDIRSKYMSQYLVRYFFISSNRK